MTVYTPDKWCVLQIEGKDKIIFKVFGTWSGGYTGADSWKLNSGITSVSTDGDYYIFNGYSGSVYRCHKDAYGTTAYGSSILKHWIDTMNKAKLEILPDRENWCGLEI